MKLLDPSAKLRGHVGQRSLVVIDGTDGSDDPAHRAFGYDLGAHSHFLHRDRVNRNGIRLSLPFVDRHHVHPHAVFARHLADLAQQHGGLVVPDLPGARVFPLPLGRAGRRRLAHGHEFHPADRAISGMILHDLRMHAAGVERLLRLRNGGAFRARESERRNDQERNKVWNSAFHFELLLLVGIGCWMPWPTMASSSATAAW